MGNVHCLSAVFQWCYSFAEEQNPVFNLGWAAYRSGVLRGDRPFQRIPSLRGWFSCYLAGFSFPKDGCPLLYWECACSSCFYSCHTEPCGSVQVNVGLDVCRGWMWDLWYTHGLQLQGGFPASCSLRLCLSVSGATTFRSKISGRGVAVAGEFHVGVALATTVLQNSPV